jgi:hypothetical protein
MSRAYGLTGKPGQVWENSYDAGFLEWPSLSMTLGWTFDVKAIGLRPGDHLPKIPVEFLMGLSLQHFQKNGPENSDTSRPFQHVDQRLALDITRHCPEDSCQSP